MKSTDIPSKMPIPFANGGQRTDILSSTVSGSNKASYPDGFPAITMLDESAGGVPPLGQNMNQILYELASAMRWANVGGLYPYDADFSTSVGGYPAGARVIDSDNRTIYVSLEDDNTDSPTSGTGTWFNESVAQLPVGVPIPYPLSTVPSGFLACNGSSFPSTYTTLATMYPDLKTPDLRGQFIRGWDNSAGVDSGRSLLSSQGDAIRNITASVTDLYFGPQAASTGAISIKSLTQSGRSSNSSSGSDWTFLKSQQSANLLDASLQVPTASENRPKNVSFQYIMRAF
ncbi:MAG: hypothetical protein [Bacteriophage sp.]|nr:MAG: hypothetical protein [Bacteriophage sp.]